MGNRRYLVPGFAVERTAVLFLVDAAPLLEEEGHTGGQAGVADVRGPFGLHGSRAGARFTSNYDPVDALQIYIWNGTKQRLEGYELYRSRCLSEMVYANCAVGFFDSDAHPYVLRPR